MKPQELLKKCSEIRKVVELYQKGEIPLPDFDSSLDSDAKKFLLENSLGQLIGVICDERIDAKVAWEIPYYLSLWMKKEKMFDFTTDNLLKLGKEEIKNWLKNHMENKWPNRLKKEDREKWLEKISESIIRACEKIKLEYKNSVENIFKVENGNIPVPLLYFILRQFYGIGPKKASMIARDFARGCDWLDILKRRLEIKICEKHFTEIPIDVHVRRVFKRLGLLSLVRSPQPQDFQNIARLIFPENPGIVDDLIWSVGKYICKTRKPKCEKCPLTSVCEFYNKKNKTFK